MQKSISKSINHEYTDFEVAPQTYLVMKYSRAAIFQKNISEISIMK